ncbi:hypothetical protein [Phycicoccus sonneratiae]|uniref:Alpha/beta hydrolase family protein n=1 Tax=Phycicoccus sonneratiae TaxID=2807628 RepID=A0ABS2CRM7_9MICO|nr:hypothetical protein [Phycicoccus sonneraticus]MBM6402103.1 hypothetical protein [Phycicoccus sonneraticus]
MRSTAWGAWTAAVLLLAGCAGGPSGADDATPSRTPTPLPTNAPATVAERCFVEGPGDLEALTGADGSSLTSVGYGSGTDAVVLLHQTGAGGLCGWVPYARWLGEHGVLALAVDDCVHGASRCTPAVTADTRAQVAVAVDAARTRGATRVAVVGASMGGARALGVGEAAGADAVVDLSGPDHWDGVPDAVAAARATSVPLLVVSSDGDTGIDGDLLDDAVAASPARVKDRWRLEGSRHGWDVVTDGLGDDAVVTAEGGRVLAWVRAALAG